MNKFDRAVDKKAKALIEKNLPDNYVDEETLRKFKIIARAMIREELRGAKSKDRPDCLYKKTWKAASKYEAYAL